MKLHTITLAALALWVLAIFMPGKSQAAPGIFEENNYFTKIGPQVHHGTALVSAFGKGPGNTPYMYIIQHGSPSALSIFNLSTGVIERTLALENSTSAWGIDVDANQNVWIGGTSSGHLYRYKPGSPVLENFGNQLKHSRDTTIQDLHVKEGKIYGSTAYTGSVFSYNPLTDTTISYGQMAGGKEFAKSVAFDSETKSVFAGVGSKAEVVRYNTLTKTKNYFLPFNYRMEKYVSDVSIVGDFVFARIDPSAKMLVFNKNTLELVNEFNISSKSISKKSPIGTDIYFTYDSKLFSYNYVNKTLSRSKAYLGPRAAISMDFVELNTPDFPGYSLVGLLTNQGEYFKYNLKTGKFIIEKIDLAQLPVTLYTMAASPSGNKILVNGFMSGGMGIYDVPTGITTEIKGISQVESIAFFDNKVYFGGYPKAKVMEFDTSMPWDASHIKEILRFQDKGQDRTTAMIGVDDSSIKKLFIGTYPETSTEGGLLSVYDPITKENTMYENYFQDQSIISLAYLQGYVYGGTTIYANHKKSADPAVLFRFPASNPAMKEVIKLPFSATMIDTLQHDNKENMWGMADGVLFSYNLTTGETKSKEIARFISGRFKNAKLLYHNSVLYGSVEGILFKADPVTLDYKILKNEGAYDLSIDNTGTLYFRNEEALWKYAAPALQ